MDPNETLKQIARVIEQTPRGQRRSSYDRALLNDLCNGLYVWLRKGGFEPNWDAYPEASSFYRPYSCSGNHMTHASTVVGSNRVNSKQIELL